MQESCPNQAFHGVYVFVRSYIHLFTHIFPLRDTWTQVVVVSEQLVETQVEILGSIFRSFATPSQVSKVEFL